MNKKQIWVGAALVCIVFMSGLLAACGDATATTAPTATIIAAPQTPLSTSTTAAASGATTSAAGGAATSAATSPATSTPAVLATATTAATTRAVSTTAASTTAAVATGTTVASSAGTASFTLPAPVSGLTEVKLGPAIAAELAKQSPVFANAAIKVYVSDDTSDKVAANLHTTLTGAGYQFAIPGQTSPVKEGTNYSGLYSKPGGSDVLFSVGDVPANEADLTKNMNVPGLSAAEMQDFVNQVKGKKTSVFLIAAPDLLKNLFAASNPSASSTTTVAAPTPTR